MNISSSAVALELANWRSQAFGSLLKPAAASGNDDLWTSVFRQFAGESESTDSLAAPASAGELKGLSPTGRNLALFNPESAYRMMSVINGNDVSYKAQFSELSEMKSRVSQMEEAGRQLGGIDLSTTGQEIASRLQAFVGQFNGWVERFDSDMQSGGLLADTQAAQVSRHELEESIRNIFNGARNGVHGLSDLGVSIDPQSGLATFDATRLDALLASNRSGTVSALQEFSGNFVKSAGLLNAAGNFIPNRLDNLHRVIDYFAENKTALQSEFGTGDAVKPNGRIAQALAAYNQLYGA